MSKLGLSILAVPVLSVHYANPYGDEGCMPGELNMTVDHIPGLFCSPKCNDILYESGCPQDKPSGQAMGECMISFDDPDEENNYCALICNVDAAKAGNDECDVAGGARCMPASGVQGVCTYGWDAGARKGAAPEQGHLQLRKKSANISPRLARPAASAPEQFLIHFETDIDGRDAFTMNITRSWAPLGADHLYELVQDGFYDGAAFFRVVGGFVLQFGIAGTPEMNQKWSTPILDDPVVSSNKAHTVSFATAGPNTRTTQLFVNYADNVGLDAQGFAPLGVVSDGMMYLDRVYDPTPGNPSGVDQDQYTSKGNTWIHEQYPMINSIKKATIVALSDVVV